MSDSPDPIWQVVHSASDKSSVRPLHSGWFPHRIWKSVDPLYLWSALAGLFAALVLIAIAQVMQGGYPH